MQYEETIILISHVCGECGISFSMPEKFINERKEDGGTFYCPNGHPRVFREPEVKRLKKELEAAERRAKLFHGYYEAEQNDHEHTRNRLRATKGVLTKTKKRVAAGVCPCCNRTFQDLSRHMAGQHPEYAMPEDHAE